MKKYIFVLIIFLLFLFPGKIMGQDSTVSAVTKYHLNFPIAELGNCTDVNSCKTYCDLEANRQACISYAKAKGFYKENPEQAKAVEYAKTELGCTDNDSCRNFCQQKEHSEKCRIFSEKHGLKKTLQPDIKQQEMLNKAHTILGCNTHEECKNMCDKEENREKCANFARANGINKENEKPKVGPGGCIGEEACKFYCADPAHKDECHPELKNINTKNVNSGQKGPGGCSSKEECKKYCDEHPGVCKGGDK